MDSASSEAGVFQIPEEWSVIGSGKNRYHKELENEFLVIDTSVDILTVLIYHCKVDFRSMSEMASWGFVRRVKINEHDGFIHIHPEGFRKLLAWYCPSSDQTYLVHFSKSQDELVQVFRKSKCH